MDECDHLCPLCCEELDLSDREFYPCKCGYQVCMWCWHRIRETESGLCPACRTPYGEDPHMFSAVDVEDVLKANKEKEAAAKRERQRQYDQQQQHQLGGQPQQQQDSGGGGGVLGSTFAAAAAAAISSASSHHHQLGNTEVCIEAPKDRSSLANMRVIRRNLVYCVGLPPNIATEENLRKPEYFGQYGKIAKIVINRSQVNATPGTDPRRASASAYVTFVHKEDTLACILAMDGFYMDNRNIRASYGTSKYCSAFIKSVRCNNPECTYLHEMGSPDDTFTKQEIQAGYATSGSCVIRSVARALPRKKVGGGGPSGTGKVAQSPVFPAPEFEEAPKPAVLVPPPPLPSAQSMQRATTVAGAGAAAAVVSSATVVGAKAGRSASVGNRSPTLSSISAAVPPAAVSVAAATAAAAPATLRTSTVAAASAPPISAASVVAGVHSVTAKAEVAGGPHTTLTPLTPLKRQKAPKPVPASAPPQPLPPPSDAAAEKLAPLRSSNNINGNISKKKTGASTSLAPSPTLTAITTNGNGTAGPSSIGGDVIGPPLPRRTSGSIAPGSMAGLGGEPFGGSDLTAIGARGAQQDTGGASGTFLGGEVFTGMLPNSNIKSSATAIGSGKDKWNSSPTYFDGRDFGSDNGNNSNGASGVSTLWDNPAAARGQNFNQGGPDTPIGGGHDSGIIGSFMTGGSGVAPSASNSSSALASILGINLPTGSGSLSGSLQESNLWSSAAPVPMSAPAMPSPLSALNECAMPVHGGGAMGGPTNYSGGSSLIGGVPIGGGGSLNPAGPIGGAGGGGGRRSDIALLQSLLPGVYITSGTENLGFNGASTGQGGFGAGSPAMAPSTMTMGLGPSGLNGDAIGNNWNGGGVIPTAAAGSSVGAIGRSNAVQQDRRGHGIW